LGFQREERIGWYLGLGCLALVRCFYGTYFRCMRFIVRSCTSEYQLKGAADTAAPKVFISHHQNMYGPIVSMKCLPEPVHLWVLSHFCNTKTCYNHLKNYTFSERFGWGRLRTFLVALLVSSPVSRLMKSAEAIPVYRESKKVMQTIEQSVDFLCKEENILIFPDIDYTDDNSEMRDIYSGFLYLEKYYYEKTGKHLAFVPLYVSKNCHSIYFGKEIYFRDNVSFLEERQNVSKFIRNNLNDLAVLCGDLK
jgi:1-acyl-sn-glycerol-3-phosphate acyltransferase